MTNPPTSPDAALRLWGGRFEGGPAAAMAALSRSVHFDWVLAPHDLRQCAAHAGVLHRAGLLSDSDHATMVEGINALAVDVASGAFLPSADDEDVHTAIERGLVERLGAVLGGRLRAGRSRNDQVATDFRLYLREQARVLSQFTLDLVEAIATQAERHVDHPSPGFTHLQHAQPVSFGHELAKHCHALLRDVDRFGDWDHRAALSPMGAGALAGSSLGLDPHTVAAELGFRGVLANSIDAVSDRDFVAEFLFVCAMLGVHLSRIGEEVCLWASREFRWVAIDDAFATGSSIMPQKKNPDAAELARGKAGRLVGHLTGLLTTLKGLPFAYNRDLQEDKEGVFDAVETLVLVLPAMTGMMATAIFDVDRMASAAPEGFALATDIAEWLVRKGIPFREAHEVAGACVRRAEARGVELWDLSDEELRSLSDHLTGAVREVLTVRGALDSRSSYGGTAPIRVREQLVDVRAAVADARETWTAS